MASESHFPGLSLKGFVLSSDQNLVGCLMQAVVRPHHVGIETNQSHRQMFHVADHDIRCFFGVEHCGKLSGYKK